MRHSILILLFTMIFCRAARGEEISLSLAQAVERAGRSNNPIQIQRKAVDAARSRVTEVRSGFFPQVNGQAGYTRNGAELTFPALSGQQSSSKDIGLFTGYVNNNQASLSAAQPIYTGGALTAALRGAQTQLAIEEQTLRAVLQDTGFETRRLYFGLLLAQETELIARDLLDQARKHAQEVRQRFAQGQASRFDVLQSEVQAARLEPDVISAGNEVELAAAQLKKLLAVPQETGVRLTDILDYKPTRVDERQFLARAYLKRPEMRLRDLGVDLSEWQVRLERAGWSPQVAASASALFRSNNPSTMFDSRHSNWNAGISVSMPVFEGFSTRARVQQAKARYEQAAYSRRDLVQQIAVDIRQACLDLDRASAVIASQKESVGLAAEALRIAEVRFANGQGTNLDVLDAQVSLSQIRTTLSQAVYDYLMAQAFLERSMGQLGEGTNG